MAIAFGFLELNAAPRGCGRLRKNKHYMGSQLATHGTIEPLVWWLGEPWPGGRMIRCNVPARTPIEINPWATAMSGELWRKEWSYTGKARPTHFQSPFGLADHVGRTHYTPFEFATEVLERGPSRLITGLNAARWAGSAPFPILFTHSEIPVFRDQAHAEALLVWFSEEQGRAAPEKLDWTPNWEQPEFGPAVQHILPHSHPMIDLLAAVEVGRAQKLFAPGKQPQLGPIDYEETVFMSSWIGYIAYTGGLSEKQQLAGISRAFIGAEEAQ